MSEDQHNDRDFFSHLNGYGETPPPQVREALQEKLAEKKKRRIGAFWWNTNGAAYVYRIAAVVVAGLLLFYFLRDRHQPELPAVAEKSAPATTPAAVPSNVPPARATENSSASALPGNKIPESNSSPSSQQPPADFSAPAPQMAQTSPTHPSRKKKSVPAAKETMEVPVASESTPQREIVYGTTAPGEENPFLPEETGSITPPAGSGCEDETVAAVSLAEPPPVTSTAPPLFPDSMKAGRSNKVSTAFGLALSAGAASFTNTYANGNASVQSASLENAEQKVISFLGGAEISASRGGWVVTTGFNYSRQEEDWSFKRLQNDIGETGVAFAYGDTTFGTFTLQNGYTAAWSDPASPGATSTLATLNATDTLVRNSYSRWSIPVLIGYRLKTGTKISIGLHTGVAYTNLLNADAWVYNIDDQRVEQTNERSDLYRRNSFDALFRLEAAYAVTDRFSVMLRPAGSLMLTSQYNDNYAAKRKSFRQSVEGGVVLMW